MSTSFKAGLPGCIFSAWLLMLGIGMWHSDAPSVPTIGYWPSLVICLGLALVAETVVKFEQTTRRTP